MAGETVSYYSGQGDMALSVDLEFRPGIYRFNLVQPSAGGDWGSVSLDSIVSVPKASFDDDTLDFPTQLRIDEACRVYATLDVSTYGEDLHWEVSITRLG